MPPGPAYNWLCVLSSVSDILVHSARLRAAQCAPSAQARARRSTEATQAKAKADFASSVEIPVAKEGFGAEDTVNEAVLAETVPVRRPMVEEKEVEKVDVQPAVRQPPVEEQKPDFSLKTEPARTSPSHNEVPTAYTLQSSRVPSSRLARLVHYGGLAASLGYGAASEIIRRRGGGDENASSSLMLTEDNIKRLVEKLSQMRGAALKLGQFLSIQDTHVLPPEIDQIFTRVQNSAHYMPDSQLEAVLQTSLGPTWMSSFTSFDRIPFAAASIGQVHRATLSPETSPTGKEERVAVKVQFPNIGASIKNDLGYIKMLLTAGRLLPKGLFLDRTVKVMGQELKDECDYAREARFLKTFGSPAYLGLDTRFKVPWVWEGSTDRVLVMQFVDGVPVGDAERHGWDQETRNQIASTVLSLCLQELFSFRMMQTDPNFSNFLWNPTTRQLALVDFGATREYEKGFMDNWLRLLQSAAREDREACVKWSLELGYLIGGEGQTMLDAHVDSMILLATPFKASTPQPFAFGPTTKWAEITNQIREFIPVMLRERLTPPPRETYSLNRKLSGAFLLASKLHAVLDTKAIWDSVVEKYAFDEKV